jgi:Tol biopolymer transport system component
VRPITQRFTIIAATVAIQFLVSVPAYATYGGSNGEIVYGTQGKVRAMLPDGSGDHRFSSLDYISSVSFSSDGTKAAVVSYTDRGDRIVLLDLAGHTRRVVLPAFRAPTQVLSSVALSPRGRRVVFSDGSYPRHLWTINVDGSNLANIAKGYGDADWGSNGRIVASNGIFHGDG